MHILYTHHCHQQREIYTQQGNFHLRENVEKPSGLSGFHNPCSLAQTSMTLRRGVGVPCLCVACDKSLHPYISEYYMTRTRSNYGKMQNLINHKNWLRPTWNHITMLGGFIEAVTLLCCLLIIFSGYSFKNLSCFKTPNWNSRGWKTKWYIQYTCSFATWKHKIWVKI